MKIFLRKKKFESLAAIKKLRIFASQLAKGALAHLARALDWQSKGDEFESRMLHFGNLIIGETKSIDKFFSCVNGFFLYFCAGK